MPAGNASRPAGRALRFAAVVVWFDFLAGFAYVA
jgi:hypothetical protein